MIETLSELVPRDLLDRSGSVFYSGKDAFSGAKQIYLLGLNPGGDPQEMSEETIRLHIKHVLHDKPNNWCAYRDESWGNAPKGTWRMQPRVIHLLSMLGFEPGEVPASNVIFVRSRRAREIAEARNALAAACWPFHLKVINDLQIKSIICFGREAGWWVRAQLKAIRKVGEFVEQNKRRWLSTAFRSNEGKIVITLPHPSIADWTSPASDPSGFVREAIPQL